MRLKVEGSPRIHPLTDTEFWDSPNNFGKLDLLTKLARIVKQTIDQKIRMATYFADNGNSMDTAMHDSVSEQ